MSFNTALSGLQAARQDLDVTANNIANANTTGFKRSTATFADVFSDTQSGAADSAGNGVQLAKITQQFDQGKIEDSNSDLHLAVNGNGFFALEGETGTVYTRDGAFLLDEEGFLVSASGLKVQAFPPVTEEELVDGGALFSNGVLEPIRLTQTVGAPQASSEVKLSLNFKADQPLKAFDVTAAVPPVINNPINPEDQSSFDYTTTLTVFDSVGNPHSATFYARRTDNNEYSGKVFIGETDITPNDTLGRTNAAGDAENTMTFTFDTNGMLTAPADGKFAMGPFDPGLGAAQMNLTYDFSGSTMLGAAFSLNDQSQDGFSTGRLTGLEIDPNGIVFAGYTNGRTEPLGKIALATFGNNQGLKAVGGNTFVDTPESGEPVLGEAGTSTFGLIQAGGLETSNVDISQQLVRLITAQRNFQAASKVISTNDQITQTAINLGR